MRQRGRQGHRSTTELLTDQAPPFIFARYNSTGANGVGVNTDLGVLTPVGEFEANSDLYEPTPTKPPFDVDQVVREQVSKFLQQQQAMMELLGPPDPSS